VLSISRRQKLKERTFRSVVEEKMGEGFVTLLSCKTEVGEQKSDTICQDSTKIFCLKDS